MSTYLRTKNTFHRIEIKLVGRDGGWEELETDSRNNHYSRMDKFFHLVLANGKIELCQFLKIEK